VDTGGLGWWGVLIAVFGGAIRVSTPFLFVSLGECLTERSGRINLGLEGILVMGAMSGYGVAYLSGSPWLGVLVAGIAGLTLGALHGLVCSLPRVNDIAVGIGLMLIGTGFAFYLGKPFHLMAFLVEVRDRIGQSQLVGGTGAAGTNPPFN